MPWVKNSAFNIPLCLQAQNEPAEQMIQIILRIANNTLPGEGNGPSSQAGSDGWPPVALRALARSI